MINWLCTYLTCIHFFFFFHSILSFHSFILLLTNQTKPKKGGGSYAGYRVRQNCDPAGGTVENERIDATMNFALCCERAGTGAKAEESPCCNNCVQQFALYFDYSYPCWSKQGKFHFGWCQTGMSIGLKMEPHFTKLSCQ